MKNIGNQSTQWKHERGRKSIKDVINICISPRSRPSVKIRDSKGHTESFKVRVSTILFAANPNIAFSHFADEEK